MNVVKMKFGNRAREIICVLFGHSWNENGSVTHKNGRVLEEYSKCSCCGLENHNRQGYLDQFHDEYPKSVVREL